MAFTLLSAGDKLYAATTANDIRRALNGVVGYGQPISLTTLDSATEYALVLKNLSSTGKALRVLDPDGNELLRIDDNGIHVSANMTFESAITVDTVDVGAHTHTGAAGHGPQLPIGAVADGWLAATATARAKMADGFITSAKIGASAVTATTIKALAVTTAKIALGAVGQNQLGDNTVVTTKLYSDAVTGAKIADDAVDSEHIAAGAIDPEHFAASAVTATAIAANAVDKTKAGNGIIQMVARQGGDATHWSTSGVSTYTPTTVVMQAGVHNTGNIAATTCSDVQTVTFPVAFGSQPIVIATPKLLSGDNDASLDCKIIQATTTLFTYTIYNADNTLAQANANWLAIGPEA